MTHKSNKAGRFRVWCNDFPAGIIVVRATGDLNRETSSQLYLLVADELLREPAPKVMTPPMAPVFQPRLCRSTPRNGPMPASMSAIKKFTTYRATRSRAGTMAADGYSLAMP